MPSVVANDHRFPLTFLVRAPPLIGSVRAVPPRDEHWPFHKPANSSDFQWKIARMCWLLSDEEARNVARAEVWALQTQVTKSTTT